VKLSETHSPRATILNRSHAILIYDEAKGELHIDSQRYAAINVQQMCQHLDSLVGPKLAETIMNNHERRLGAEDAERIRELNPGAKIEDVIGVLIEDDKHTGFGIPKVTITGSSERPAIFETFNPVTTATEGAGRVFIASYWVGALGVLLGHEVIPTNVAYDPAKNTLSCSFIKKG
jgi:hypothetical protein